MPGGPFLQEPGGLAPLETSSDEDEEAPLQTNSNPGYDGPTMTSSFTSSYRVATGQEMSIKPSVFMHVFYLPEMIRMNRGASKEANACMTLNAVVLFALTITLQVGLTVIAGLQVLQEHHDWKSTILFNRPGKIGSWENALKLDMPRKTTVGELTFGKGDTGGESSQCCGSFVCAYTSRSCCDSAVGKGDPSGHAFLDLHAHHNASNGKPSSSAAKKISKGGGGETGDDVAALCQNLGGGKYSCASPSVRYTARWNELDADSDGVWSWAEAVQDWANLGCRLGISQEDMFRSACRAVELDIRDGGEYRGINRVVPQFIKERKELPKSFFEWYSGLAALCSAMDQVHCSSLVAEGVFGMAMNPEYGNSVGLRDLDSVMDYCNRLLQPDGLCTQMMPSTYMVYRSLAADKCGDASLTMGPLFRNPYNHLDSLRLLEAEFASVTTFRLVNSSSFEAFFFLVVMLWFFNLMNETKESVAVLDFLLSVEVSKFPTSQGSSRKVMSCITRPHQLLLGCMVIIRLSLLAYMSIVGTIFLASNHGFIELLCNAVALAFVFELDEFIYMFLVSSEVKKQLENLKPAYFSSKLPGPGFTSFLLKREFWGFVALPLLALSFVVWHRRWNLQPVYNALTCLCQKHVDSCVDFDQFRASWWDGYWKNQAVLSE